MKIVRRFTKANVSPFDEFQYVKRNSSLKNSDGSLVFEMKDIEVPEHWSQLATDILAQKYFRKAGVPLKNPDGSPLLDSNGNVKTGSETSVKQVVHRLASTWRHWGEKYNYFASSEDAEVFYDEIVYMLLNQMCAPNSPQWFNTGLNLVYGITGKSQGHYYVDNSTGELCESTDAYSRPQTSACFIQSIEDDLVNEGGIFDLLSREARIFKYGSGTGTNFSSLRGQKETLSGGGMSSGLMSFLKIFDRAAGAIKSGGTTRRAAKMVILDIDHPDVEEFIEWKAAEEDKVANLVSGSKIAAVFLQAILDEAIANGTNIKANKKLANLVQKGLNRGIPMSQIQRVLDLVDMGYTSLKFNEFNTHYEGEAYLTVSGQNSNNSIRVTADFMRALENDGNWELKLRNDSSVSKVVKARELWDKINLSAWRSADPGIQYDTTINEWHTCPNSGRINASNPCSEYMFLDDTACNLASINLRKFWDEEKAEFQVDDYRYTIRLWTIVLEISIVLAQFPSKLIAQRSYEFRTLGLGYANIGSLFMVAGIPYDSPEALAMTGALSAILTAEAYATSAEMANEQGTFKFYKENRNDMLRVIRNHRRAAYNAPADEYEKLTITPLGIDETKCPSYLLQAARDSWDKALELGEKYGFRNAQVTVIAPTGTIALIMDCDTTGIEPDFAIVKYKKLAGGGYFKIVNQSVKIALKKLGYSDAEIKDIENYTTGTGSLLHCPYINEVTLKERDFSKEKIDIIKEQLATVFDIKFAFNKYTLGEDFLLSLGFKQEDIDDPQFDVLTALGFSNNEIEKANDFICGTMTIEGAPHLKDEHLPVFDCANKCGKKGKRFISYMAHLRIMAAAQPFITGAISKTVNMPEKATVSDIGEVYLTAWKMMIKAIALYRDCSKLSQPLNVAVLDGLDEVVTLGDNENLDETKGPQDIHKAIETKLTRQRLPKRRRGITREATVGGQKIFLRTGEYEDGSLGEIFIDMYKEGASFRGLINSFAILASKALQYGIPLSELVDTFTFTRFEPSGIVQGHESVKFASSILDYVFRSLGYDYLNRTDFVHNKSTEEEVPNIKENNNENGTVENTLNEVLEKSNNNSSENNTKNTIETISKILKALKEENESIENNLQLPFENDVQTSLEIKEEISISSSNYARSMGYTGEQCANCGSIHVKRNGSCMLCEDCGTTSGCS